MNKAIEYRPYKGGAVAARSKFQEIIFMAQANGAGRLTLRRMAEEIGDPITVDFLLQLKNDKIDLLNLDRAAAVCAAFGIGLGDLFAIENKPAAQGAGPVELEGKPGRFSEIAGDMTAIGPSETHATPAADPAQPGSDQTIHAMVETATGRTVRVLTRADLGAETDGGPAADT